MSSPNPHEVFIRLATEVDAELVASLSRNTFFDSYAEFNTRENIEKFMSEQFTMENLMEEVVQPWHIFYLAFINNEAVGYVKLRQGSEPSRISELSCLEIARIYVVARAIGTGVGKKLMETCIDVAKQKGKKCLWLGVWKKNQRAINFYSKWGFKIVGEQKFLLGDDLQKDWLMVMRLPREPEKRES